MTADALSTVFGALADPTRRAILAQLARSDLTVNELNISFPISQPAISRHLKVLESAGLVSRERRATARLSHLEAVPLKEASDWLAKYRAYWEESFGRLDVVLEQLQQEDRGREGGLDQGGETVPGGEARQPDGRQPDGRQPGGSADGQKGSGRRRPPSKEGNK